MLELRLELVELTQHDGQQLELLPAAGGELDVRLREGLRQVRASTGSGSVNQVVEVAPWSRIPEARALFVPRDELNEPRAAVVEARVDGTPVRVNRLPVELVREEWRVVDRWWTEEPVSRRYFEVVLQSGENAVVFRDEERSCWFNGGVEGSKKKTSRGEMQFHLLRDAARIS